MNTPSIGWLTMAEKPQEHYNKIGKLAANHIKHKRTYESLYRPTLRQPYHSYLDLMERYNLLPNDSLIIGSAKLHGISVIASYDPDCQLACEGEGIQLIQEVADIA